jgi:hypothetical protein
MGCRARSCGVSLISKLAPGRWNAFIGVAAGTRSTVTDRSALHRLSNEIDRHVHVRACLPRMRAYLCASPRIDCARFPLTLAG